MSMTNAPKHDDVSCFLVQVVMLVMNMAFQLLGCYESSTKIVKLLPGYKDTDMNSNTKPI